MEIIAVSFTSLGIPATGLNPTVSIRERDGTQRIVGGVCYELAGGRYLYNFNEYSSDKNYLYTFDGGNTLADSDRYKMGGNDLDSYSNKYSWGRTSIPTANYAPSFKKLEKNFKDLPKAVKYDDTELKTLVSDLRKIIDAKNNSDVTSMITNLSKDINKLNDTIKSIDVSENIDIIGEGITGLNNSLLEIKDGLREDMLEVESMIGERINGFDEKISTNMDNKYTAEMLGKPVANLDKKIEDLFMSVMSRQVPEHLLDKFEVSLKKKGETARSDEEILKELESLATNE